MGALAGGSACGGQRSQKQPTEAPAQVTVPVAEPGNSDTPEDEAAAPTRAEPGPPDPDGRSADCCKGMNECKGMGGCATDANDCRGKNECKGLGGCAPHCPK